MIMLQRSKKRLWSKCLIRQIHLDRETHSKSLPTLLQFIISQLTNLVHQFKGLPAGIQRLNHLPWQEKDKKEAEDEPLMFILSLITAGDRLVNIILFSLIHCTTSCSPTYRKLRHLPRDLPGLGLEWL